MNVSSFLRYTLSSWSGEMALRTPSRTLTYEDLDRHTGAVATRIRAAAGASADACRVVVLGGLDPFRRTGSMC